MPGSSPDVGVVGYTLGGGLSWLGRKHGFACNRVTAIELVTAEGEQRTVDADNGADLFWALRGGGGGYAIVTALHIDMLRPAGGLRRGARLSGRGRRRRGPHLPRLGRRAARRGLLGGPLRHPAAVPRRARADPRQAAADIDGACIGTKEEGEAAIAPLRAEIGETIMDTYDWMPTAGLSRIHMDPENPVPGIGEGGLVGELTDQAIDAFVGVAGPESGSPLLLSELRRLGGAFGRPAENAGALEPPRRRLRHVQRRDRR